MALVVEKCSGVSGANSYVSLTYLNEYHSIRGKHTKWDDFLEEEKEAAAVRAMMLY
jgi:hypothetical protein